MNPELAKLRQHYQTLPPHVQERTTAQSLLRAIQIAEHGQNIADAASKVVAAFEAGFFVRNTEGDSDPHWAIKAMPHIAALGALQVALSVTTKPA